MFGDLLGNMQQQQEALQEKLATIELSASSGDGAVKVTVTATQQVVDISIDKSKIEDMEQLEDLLIVAMNQALAMAVDMQTTETNNLVKDMMPPGLGGLGDLFGK